MAEPLCRPPSLTGSVHDAREGPAPRAQVFSLWALLCPSPGVSGPLGGAAALPCPSSCGDVTVADLVKPRAKRGRVLRLGGDIFGLAPCSPRWPSPPRDPAWACWGWRALAIRHAPGACPRPRWCAGVPPPPPLAGLPPCAASPLEVGVPLLVPAVMPSWASCPLPFPGLWPGGGGCSCHALLEWGGEGGRGSGGAAPWHPLGERGSGRGMGGGAVLCLCPPPPRPWLPCGASACVGPHP